MAKNPLADLVDPGKYTHVSSDNDKTVLKHKAGHTLTVAHKALSPKMQAQLKALSGVGKEAQTPTQSNEAQEAEKHPYGRVIQKDAEGGEVCMAEGGDAEESALGQALREAPSDAARAIKNIPETAKDYADAAKSMLGMSRGGEVNPKLEQSKKTPPRAMYAEGTPQVDVGGVSDITKQPAYPSDTPVIVPAEHKTAFEKQFPEAAQWLDDALAGKHNAFAAENQKAETAQPKTSLNAPQASQIDAASEAPNTPAEAAAPSGEAPEASNPPPAAPAPAAAPAQVPAPAPTQAQAPGATAAPTFEQHKNDVMNEFSQEMAATQHDLANGHITPKTYQSLFNDENTLGKVGTLFGMLVSGMGSGLAHQSNAVLDAMNKTIQNDFDAQVHSKANAQNLYKLSLEHELNKANVARTGAETANIQAEANMKAMALARIRANQMALHKLTQDVANLPAGSAKRAQAEQTLAMVANSVQSENYNLMDKAAANAAYYKLYMAPQQGATNEDAWKQRNSFLQMNNPERAKFEAERHVPNVGDASIPVPQDTRTKLVGHQKLASGLQDLDNTLSQLTTMNHLSSAYKTGVEKVQKLQADLREGVLGTVYREGEQPLLDQMLKMPASKLTEYQTRAQIKALKDINNRDFGTLKASVGIPETSDSVKVISPQGQTGSIPKANLQKAIAAGYKPVGS